MEAGFVHVTGLTSHGPEEGKTRLIGENTPITSVGCWESNNGKTQIITEGGEIWLARTTITAFSKEASCAMDARRTEALKRFAPRGRGCWVECSNGEQLRSNDLLARLTDPDWIPTT
jgi:hypothetical protein